MSAPSLKPLRQVYGWFNPENSGLQASLLQGIMRPSFSPLLSTLLAEEVVCLPVPCSSRKERQCRLCYRHFPVLLVV